MAPSPDAVVAERAAKQHGTFSLQQAFNAGFTAKMIRRRLASGEWVRLHPRVFALSGAPATWERRLWAAYLSCPNESLLARESALALNGIDLAGKGKPRLTIPPHARAPKGLDVRRAVVERKDRTTRKRLPCTTVARAIVDMAGDLDLAELTALIDEAVTERKLKLDALQDAVLRLCHRGRAGSALLKLIAEDRRPGTPVPASVLERSTLELLKKAGYNAVLQHRPAWREGTPSGIVDFYIHELKMIVEADGRRWHAREAEWENDRERDLDAAAHGYRVVRITWLMVTKRPHWTLERLILAAAA